MSDRWTHRISYSVRWWPGWTVLCLMALVPAALRGADAADARRDLLAGNYDDVIKHAEAALRESTSDPEWSPLLVQALLAVGRNADASAATTTALKGDAMSVQLRWLAREVAFANGRPEEAAQ